MAASAVKRRLLADVAAPVAPALRVVAESAEPQGKDPLSGADEPWLDWVAMRAPSPPAEELEGECGLMLELS